MSETPVEPVVVPDPPIEWIEVHTHPKHFQAIQITAENMEDVCRIASIDRSFVGGGKFSVEYYNGVPSVLAVSYRDRSIGLEAGEWLLTGADNSYSHCTDEEFKKRYIVEEVDPIV